MAAPVAFVTPTLGRQHLHPQLHATFRAQTVPDKRLYVLDESPSPSPYFSSLKDEAVNYVHRVAQPRTDGLSRVGAARNAANALTPDGAVLVHLDDDDILAPSYAAQMIDRLGDADLCKLDVWRILHEASGLLFEWDTRKVGDKHYALLGDSVAAAAEATAEITQEFMELLGVRDGFGFSLVYPRKTWERHPFPNEDTEDLPFVQSVRDAGGKIVFVSDLPHLVLHLVSKMSKIACYPQRLLGAAAAEKQARLRSAVARRMLGAMGAMTELPQGKTIRIAPGATYSVLAEVKDKHSLKALTNRAERMGVTITSARDNVDASEFGAPEPADGYRLVLAIGTPSEAAMLPWKAPGFFATYDKSHVVKAWTGAGVSEGTKARSAHDIVKGRLDDAFGAGDVVECYDPARYAGKEPPHRCTRASATAIARQIDPAWTIAPGSASGVDGMTEIMANVVTPMGPKTIPTWQKGQQMVLQCPYTGELFLFTKAPKQLGAAGPALPSASQLGLSSAGSDAMSWSTDQINQNVDPSGTTSDAIAQGLAAAGGWSGMTEQQQTQFAEGAADTIVGAFTLGVGGIVLQYIFNAVGLAGSGPGCYCPGQPQPAGSYPCPDPFVPVPTLAAGANPFSSLCNALGVAEWNQDASCSGKIAWQVPSDSYSAWLGIVANAAAAWNKVTDTTGPAMLDLDGMFGIVPSTWTGPKIPAGQTLVVRTVLASSSNAFDDGQMPAFGDAIGVALNQAALVANGDDGSFTWTNTFSPVAKNTAVSFLINSGKTRPPAQIAKGKPVYTPGAKSSSAAVSGAYAVAALALLAGGVGLWGMSAGLGYGAAWKALGSKLAAQTTASGNLLLGARVPMLAAEKPRSRRGRRRA